MVLRYPRSKSHSTYDFTTTTYYRLHTTQVGLNGLGLPAGQNTVFASDEPAAFAGAVLRLQQDASLFE